MTSLEKTDATKTLCFSHHTYIHMYSACKKILNRGSLREPEHIFPLKWWPYGE